MHAPDLAAKLVSRRYRAPMDEARLQEEIAALLTVEGFTYEREVRLTTTDRIDFMVGGIGIEVKVQGSALAVMRQLLRYAEHERVSELILFTTRAQIVVPSELGGKPVHTARYYAGL